MAHCIEQQVSALNALVYPGSEVASADAAAAVAEASALSGLLDVLDDLSKQEQEWWTVKIEPRR